MQTITALPFIDKASFVESANSRASFALGLQLRLFAWVQTVFFLIMFLLLFSCCRAQPQSMVRSVQDVPMKYVSDVEKKIDKYNARINGKTEKTLVRLVSYENKIHNLLLQVNPDAAHRLFDNNNLTFSAALEKFRSGQAIIAEQKSRYDEYTDKLTVSIKYLNEQQTQINAKYIGPLKSTRDKLGKLEDDEARTEAVKQFIKERKKQLFIQSVQYIGNSKYLAGIDKESYYYVETLKNYKDIFSDEKKAEQTALLLLNKIPAFLAFTRNNSMLASLFGSPSVATNSVTPAGLQTRSSIDQLIQGQLSAAGSASQNVLQQNVQQAQNELNNLKDRIFKAGGTSNTDTEIPDFKPVQTKSMTFLQRLEFGSNLQAEKANSLLPAIEDIGLSLGYKMSAKGIIGIGVGYKLGLGTLQHIHLDHQGASIRSFIDWKLKKEFYLTGGFEMNYNAAFKNIEQLQAFNEWQQSALFGLSKKIGVKNKWLKGTKLSFLYDALGYTHIPVSQPLIFRVGYNF